MPRFIPAWTSRGKRCEHASPTSGNFAQVATCVCPQHACTQRQHLHPTDPAPLCAFHRAAAGANNRFIWFICIWDVSFGTHVPGPMRIPRDERHRQEVALTALTFLCRPSCYFVVALFMSTSSFSDKRLVLDMSSIRKRFAVPRQPAQPPMP